MSQIHLYGNPFIPLNPPNEWPETGIDSTLNDSVLEANVSSNVFTFSGKAAQAIQQWILSFGVHNGMPYRVVYYDGTYTNTVVDACLNLREAETLSNGGPLSYRIPLILVSDAKTVLDEMAVMTQGALRKNGWLTHLDYVDVPFIFESKKNIVERALIIRQFGFSAFQALTSIITDILSGISNVLGLSAPIGLVQLGLVFANAWFTIQKLVQDWNQIKNLIWPQIAYYKAISFKQLLTKAFASKGYTIDLGELDSWASDTYILGSKYEDNGLPFPGFPVTGEMKRSDYGYIIAEFIDGFNTMQNLRIAIIGTVVHIKRRSDPFWNQAPVYTPDNVLIKTVKQYANGVYRHDVDSVKGTNMLNYAYDIADGHTLTEKSGDSHEVRRKLLTELNPKFNLLKGIDNLEIPWAMCVRKKPFDNLYDLFNSSTNQFNTYLQQVKDIINQFLTDINAAGAPIGTDLASILAASPLGTFLQNREGVLKVEDNSWTVPKVLYLKKTYIDGLGFQMRIPENFKDFIGAKPLYVQAYFPMSPADLNGFNGQFRLIDDLTLKWAQPDFVQTQTNPHFILNSKNCYFTFTNWVEDRHKAQVNIKMQDPFDTNITEVEI